MKDFTAAGMVEFLNCKAKENSCYIHDNVNFEVFGIFNGFNKKLINKEAILYIRVSIFTRSSATVWYHHFLFVIQGEIQKF
jgi:hypothetical protein